MPRTKIVATIGPASSSRDAIRKLLQAGMNVARINFSHGDHSFHAETVRSLREVAAEEGHVLGIMGDLQGPKIRLGYVKTGGIQLERDEDVVLTPHRGQPAMIHLPHPDVIKGAQPGAKLLIGDGEVELTVTEKISDTLRCKVTVPGLLESRKGVSAPGAMLPISCLTEKDVDDLGVICELNLDYVALSFVRTAEDILELHERMMQTNGKVIPIIAKIEKSEAIDHLEAIRDAADGMMVARGDLGIEMPPQEVPLLQKRIIRCCNDAGKPVITATQMLQSMVDHPRPTRAEASDVANAILDGSDAIMLSAETAAGNYPVDSVLMMRQIAEITEKDFPYNVWRTKRQETLRATADVTEAISAASCAVAELINAQAIVSTTMSGHTARQIARHRPVTPIVAVSPSEQTQRRLSMVWGVECLVVDNMFASTDDMISQTVSMLEAYHVRRQDRIVITAGVPFGSDGQTNLIQVHEIE